MFIHQLQLINYKNHKKKSFLFDKKFNCFTGLNGVGKTNILDAIYFMCIGKSYFTSADKNCLKFDEAFFRLTSTFEVDENQDDIVVKLEKGKRKKIERNEVPIHKLTDYVGKYPVVIVAPDDNVLILGASDERRKFIDQTLSQADNDYLKALSTYQKILVQRNALLKSAEKKGLDKNLLEVYNTQLIPLGEGIFSKRKQFITEIEPHFNKIYKEISNDKELFILKYKSHLFEGKFSDLLVSNFQKDLILQRTTKGIHRDDLLFSMNGEPLKTFGSQGQQKTFLLALKLAQYEFLRKQIGVTPIFLIDDMFDKLDNERGRNLLNYISKSINQVFLTHTNKSDLEPMIKDQNYVIFEI
jgi:DNA replication and repair protein RecF